jgi:hypothetical protein
MLCKELPCAQHRAGEDRLSSVFGSFQAESAISGPFTGFEVRFRENLYASKPFSQVSSDSYQRFKIRSSI